MQLNINSFEIHIALQHCCSEEHVQVLLTQNELKLISYQSWQKKLFRQPVLLRNFGVSGVNTS